MKEEELGPLFLAITQGDAGIAHKLISAHPDIAHESYLNLGSFLHIAANEGQIDISRLLIAAGADVNKATDTRLFRTPLCVAAREGHVELTALLLENGAFVDGIDATSHSPLMLAAREGHIEIVKLLLEAGAEINQLGVTQRYLPVDFAMWLNPQSTVIELLRSYGGRSVADDFDWENEPGFPVIAHVSRNGGPVYPVGFSRQVDDKPFIFRLASMRAKDNPLFLFSAGLYETGQKIEVAFSLPAQWPLKQRYLKQKSALSFPLDLLERLCSQIAQGRHFSEGSLIKRDDPSFVDLGWPESIQCLVAVNHQWRAKSATEPAIEDCSLVENGLDMITILTLAPVLKNIKFKYTETAIKKWCEARSLANWSKILLPLS